MTPAEIGVQRPGISPDHGQPSAAAQKGKQKAFRTEAQPDPSAGALNACDPSDNRLPRDHAVRFFRHVIALDEEAVSIDGLYPVHAEQFCFRMDKSHHVSPTRRTGSKGRYADHIAIFDEGRHAVSAGVESEGQSLRMHGLHQFNQGFPGKGLILHGGTHIFTRWLLRRDICVTTVFVIPNVCEES